MKKQGKVWVTAMAAMMVTQLAVAEPTLDISGLVEAEVMSGEDYVGTTSKDVTLATVELAFDAKVNEHVSAHVAFLYEEDVTDFSLDEGTATLVLSNNLVLTAGKMYVPFGRFDTFMVSDPQTLVMGETIETVLMLSDNNNGTYSSVYLFNGDSDEASKFDAGENSGTSYGINAGVIREGVYDIGLSYISNIADTNTLQSLETTAARPGVVDSAVAGASAYFSVTFGSVTLLGEHFTARDSFTNGDLDGTVTNEEQPSASNFEIGVDLGRGVTMAAAVQRTREAQFIGLPETVTAATVAFAVADGATFSTEYARLKDYPVSAGGTGKSARSVIMQLAVEF